MLPKTAYWNIWEHPRNFVTKENKSENANVTCKCHLLINISHRVIFDMWHIRDIQYVLLLSLSAPPTFSKVIILFHTAQKMKFSIKDLFSKFDQSTGNCRPGHIYWRNHESKTYMRIYTMSYLTLSRGHCMFLDQNIFSR